MSEGSGSARIGFVGLGTMGAAMAANLAGRGFSVTGWNRTPGRPEAAVAAGVVVAGSLAELAGAADTVVICVSDTPDVEAVLFGDEGLAAVLQPGRLVIDCSTIAPAASRAIAERLGANGIRFVDAPMSGGSEGARNATLAFFVGGDASDVERARPVLEAMGRTVTHVGPVGSGQAVKAVNQVVLAGTYLGVAEGMVLALKAGLDPGQVAESLGGGAAQSWVLANRSGRMIANDYPLGFRTSLHLKDLAIALDLARSIGATLPVAALAAQLEAGLVAEGHGDEDISNLARAIRRLSGLEG
jgi:3-hydroxyisobutyrate dehydrogenase